MWPNPKLSFKLDPERRTAYIDQGGLLTLLPGITHREVQRHYFGQNGIVLILFRKEM